MRRRLWATLISTVVIVIVLFIGAIATGTTPILGLDLQGGVSVILAPVESAAGDDLIVIRDLIRSELENQGIAEPDVRVQGQAIVVDLPGVKDQQEALDAVDVSGVVELRPVVELAQCAAAAVTPGDVTETTIASGTVPAASTPATTAPASGSANRPPPHRPPPHRPGSGASSRPRPFPHRSRSPLNPSLGCRPDRPRPVPNSCRHVMAPASVSAQRRGPVRCSPVAAPN